MKSRISLAIVGFLSVGAVHAQFARSEGTFTSPAATVRVVLLDQDKGIAAASAVVVAGSCSASVSGVGQIQARVLSIEPYVKVPGGEACKVDFEFDRSWKQVKVSSHGCSSYGGASCGFEGQTARRRDDR